MNKQNYRICIHCKNEIISTRHGDHERKCIKLQEERIRIKKPIGHQHGASAWNKGLSKETDVRVANTGVSISNMIQKKIIEGTFIPNKMGLVARQELSERQSNNNSGGKCKWFSVNGVLVQGTWERDFALKMIELGIKWIKVKGTPWKYELNGNIKNYTPDFFLPEFDLFIEIKGYWWGNDKKKMECVIEQHPNKNIRIIEKLEFEKIMRSELVW